MQYLYTKKVANLQSQFSFGGVLLGGEDGYKWAKKLQSVERFDPNQNRWERVADLNEARSGHGAFVYRGKIFVLGG